MELESKPEELNQALARQQAQAGFLTHCHKISLALGERFVFTKHKSNYTPILTSNVMLEWIVFWSYFHLNGSLLKSDLSENGTFASTFFVNSRSEYLYIGLND